MLVGLRCAAITKASTGAATFDWTLSVLSNVTSGGFTYTGSGSLTATMTGDARCLHYQQHDWRRSERQQRQLVGARQFLSVKQQSAALNGQPFLLGSNGFSRLVASIGDINVFTFGGNGSGNDWGEFGPTGVLRGESFMSSR